MSTPRPEDLETDPRFPSGPWTGFFLDRRMRGRQKMELRLTFAHGSLTGDGRDRVGQFVIHGRYAVKDGHCHWTKRYLGAHDVFYRGFNEGKGIWGTWEIPPEQGGPVQGGFHIWPEGMPDPTQPHLTEQAALPVAAEQPVKTPQRELAPVG